MSKRHATSRRRAYGRRQHEIHERLDRRAERTRPDRAWRPGQDLDPGLFLDGPSGDAPYGFAD